MMNFSAFGGPFSGIHQFAAKFNHDPQSQSNFGVSHSIVNGGANSIDNTQRYQPGINSFNQATAISGNITVIYWLNFAGVWHWI